MIVEAQQGLLDAEMLQQAAGTTGIFAGHQIGHRQGFLGTVREIAEVADGRRDEDEVASHDPSSLAALDQTRQRLRLREPQGEWEHPAAQGASGRGSDSASP
jgi:hypothetical protein